jgi:hypothetical protein
VLQLHHIQVNGAARERIQKANPKVDEPGEWTLQDSVFRHPCDSPPSSPQLARRAAGREGSENRGTPAHVGCFA